MINMDFLNKLDNELTKKFSQYTGLQLDEISNKVSLNHELVSKKRSVVTIVNKMLKVNHIDKNKLTEQADPKTISIKTVRLQSNGKPKESMSFENVDFLRILQETWMTSKLRNKFADTIFLFVVFQYQQTTEENKLLYKGVKV